MRSVGLKQACRKGGPERADRRLSRQTPEREQASLLELIDEASTPRIIRST
jgi:hypothetical protein